MLTHHAESLTRMVDLLQRREGVLGVVFGGSVAQGRERPDSDLDAMVVLEDEIYARLRAENRLCECIHGHCTYPGGYFDVKYMTMDYLRAAAEHGSDPTRNSFVKSRVMFSRVEDLEDIVRRIQTYPVAKKRERIELFASILLLSGGYLFDCARIDARDSYLTPRAVCDAVYGGLRMLLARNEVFFPCHRNMMAYAARLPDAPENIADLANAFLAGPTPATRDAFTQAICRHPGWDLDFGDHNHFYAVYVKYMEQSWLESEANVFEL